MNIKQKMILSILNKINPVLPNREYKYRIFDGRRRIFLNIKNSPSMRKRMLSVFEEEYGQIINNYLKPSMVFAEVGAYLGYHSLYATLFTKNVHAVEPNPFNIEKLEKNIKINNLQEIITLHKIAASDQKGESIFYSNKSGQSSFNSIYGDKIRVQTDKLDDILDDLNMAIIDVEGAELKVIRGAKRIIEKNYPLIFLIDMHPQHNIGINDVISELGDGFNYFLLHHRKLMAVKKKK